MIARYAAALIVLILSVHAYALNAPLTPDRPMEGGRMANSG